MKVKLFLLLGLIFPLAVSAEGSLEEDIANGLSRFIPDVEIDSIQKTPVEGLYQVMIGPDVIYMTRDGAYVFKGDLLDIKNRKNITEDVRASAREKLLADLDKNDYIEFAAKDPQDAIYVFTDIDCGYCRKLHKDVPELNARGVSVRYLAFPRAGIHSATAREMGYVWCAKDRQSALTAAKNNEAIEPKECNAPIAEQYELGQRLGVRGTPAIYLENGKSLPGYMPPDKIISLLGR